MYGYLLKQFSNDARGPPINKDDLIQHFVEVGTEFPRDYTNHLYASIPRRLEAVKKMHGYLSKY